MSGLFKGSTVLITGAAGGFGSAAARRFGEEGANLVLSDYNAEALEATCGQIAADHGCDIASLAGDVADESLSERLSFQKVCEGDLIARKPAL